MADTRISALTAVATPAGEDEYATNQAGVSKRTTLDQIRAYPLKLISGNSGDANQNGAPSETWQLLTSNAAVNVTATIATVMTTTNVPAGTYRYRYDIIVQAAALTTSVKFSVDATGTVTKTVAHLFFPSQGVTAATGVADQITGATTGHVWAHFSTRSDGAVLGPGTDVDTVDADIHMVFEGILVTSTNGSLLLGHASEVAANSTVMSGTSLKLERLA